MQMQRVGVLESERMLIRCLKETVMDARQGGSHFRT
jgi:hypothetical protein